MAGMPDLTQLARIVFRLAVAALLGGIIGAQRERAGKEAGLRTHMLVALGAALFIVAPIEFGMSSEDLARIIQGLVAGIGFLGAGAILKLTAEHQIKGLTSAAALWLTAAVGVAAGLGRWGSAMVGVALIWFILDVLARFEERRYGA
jgi:putative Mg2+ transporter-C (MgtC) family protein